MPWNINVALFIKGVGPLMWLTLFIAANTDNYSDGSSKCEEYELSLESK